MRARLTRGKTKPGRLDALDRVLLRLDPPVPDIEPLGWDLGFGAHPHTTLAWAEHLAQAGWNAQLLGLEAHEGRARFAARHSTTRCRFAHLDDSRPAPWDRKPRWIRAMNLLRQYPAEQASAWHQRWIAQLATDGHLIEGTCSSDGAVLVAHWMRKTETGFLRKALIFYTNFQQGFAPLLFGDRLPKDLRAHARQPGAIGDFLRRWTAAWQPQRGLGPQASFLASAHAMQQANEGVQAWSDAQGAVLVWSPPGGVPVQD